MCQGGGDLASPKLGQNLSRLQASPLLRWSWGHFASSCTKCIITFKISQECRKEEELKDTQSSWGGLLCRLLSCLHSQGYVNSAAWMKTQTLRCSHVQQLSPLPELPDLSKFHFILTAPPDTISLPFPRSQHDWIPVAITALQLKGWENVPTPGVRQLSSPSPWQKGGTRGDQNAGATFTNQTHARNMRSHTTEISKQFPTLTKILFYFLTIKTKQLCSEQNQRSQKNSLKFTNSIAR